jgi:hypothetical protein
MVELWNSGDLEAWLDEIGPILPRKGLADSPVNRCMLLSTRLSCLKKPTEEARGG